MIKNIPDCQRYAFVTKDNKAYHFLIPKGLNNLKIKEIIEKKTGAAQGTLYELEWINGEVIQNLLDFLKENEEKTLSSAS